MKAIILDKHQADIIDRPEPELQSPEDVKVKLSYASIGGHDMMVFNGKMAPFYGKSLGMEASAVVTEVGENVVDYHVGDHVSFELVNACGLCSMCKRGLPSFCLNARDTVGQMQEFVVIHQKQLVPLHKDVSLKEGCFMEPLALCLKCIEAIPHIACKRVLILGGGAMGLITLKTLQLYPVASVVLSDPTAKKREMAKKFGADRTFDSKEANYIFNVLDYVGSEGYDVVIETSGNPESAKLAVTFAARGGIVIFNGLYGMSFNLPLNLFNCYWKDITIRAIYPPGSPYYVSACNILPKLELSDIITSIFPFERAAEAFRAKAAGGEAKVMLDFTEHRFKNSL